MQLYCLFESQFAAAEELRAFWFDMARHATNALRRADASCFESFARRLAGETDVPSCVDHTAG